MELQKQFQIVDELILDRTLKDEFMSVFAREQQVVKDLRAAEKELEQLTGDGSDADQMQEILDRMQDLQNEAETLNVATLESRATKIMNLMGFEEYEEEYLVGQFSGGWKMRIGLGKVLLKEPNILLLGEF